MPIIWRKDSSSGSWSAGTLPVTATSCCTLISRPGVKRLKGVTWLGEGRHSYPKETPRPGLQDKEAFCDRWKTQVSPVTFFVYVMVKTGETAQTRRHPDSGLFSLTTFVPHSSLPLECIATLILVVLGAKQLMGEPQEAAETN